MKYLKLFESFENTDIVDICKQYNISNYVVNPDGSIDVNNYVNLQFKDLTKLPLKFNKVNGSFSCGFNRLTTLEGSPKEVNGDFYCHNNKLTSFEFSPKIIRGIVECEYNNIKSFEYFPSYVKEWVYCEDNPIYQVWILFGDTTKIELLNDFDIFRDEDTDTPSIVMVRLNDFLLTIGKDPVEKVDQYKNI
jgi:hypothetical protein